MTYQTFTVLKAHYSVSKAVAAEGDWKWGATSGVFRICKRGR